MSVRLEINGIDHTVDADPATPLLLVLRNDLGFVGARYGCGAGYCGSCTVLIDGKPTPSCDVSVEAAARSEIVTIEGLFADGRIDSLYQAFLELQAAQCGYCIPGIIVSASALLDTVTDPTRSEIVEALGEHLCRCGAHNRILAAIQRAALLRSQP